MGGLRSRDLRLRHYRDPGCNVAYWNLDHRDLTIDAGSYQVNGLPLKFFHFSGYSPEQPHLLSKHQSKNPRILLSERPAVRQICDEYGDLLAANGFGVDDQAPYGLGVMANGVPLDHTVRLLYRRWLDEADEGEGPYPAEPVRSGRGQRTRGPAQPSTGRSR